MLSVGIEIVFSILAFMNCSIRKIISFSFTHSSQILYRHIKLCLFLWHESGGKIVLGNKVDYKKNKENSGIGGFVEKCLFMCMHTVPYK